MHPNCVTMGAQLLNNIEWSLANITEGVNVDSSEQCVIDRIRANL
jgi:hypothetical protein